MTRKDFLNKAILIKGEIINYCNIIEFLTNYYLSSNVIMKNTFFGMAVINKLNFNDKIKILKAILSENENDYLRKYPDLISNINTIQQLRNKFAHSIFSIEQAEDYSKLDRFTMMKTEKFDANDFEKTEYKISSHHKNVDIFMNVIKEVCEIAELSTDIGQ